MLYARKCSECGAGMSEGYVIEMGCAYYCSDECLSKNYTQAEWESIYSDHFGDSYYTEWEDETEFEYFEVDLEFARLLFEIESSKMTIPLLVGDSYYMIHYDEDSNSVSVMLNNTLVHHEEIFK